MRNYKIKYNDNKVTIVTDLDAAHAKDKLKKTVKVTKFNSCKIIKS